MTVNRSINDTNSPVEEAPLNNSLSFGEVIQTTFLVWDRPDLFLEPEQSEIVDNTNIDKANPPDMRGCVFPSPVP